MHYENSPSQLHAWLAWLCFVGIGVVLVLLFSVYVPYQGTTWTVAMYLHEWRQLNVSGPRLADWNWTLFLFTSVFAMYRISKGEIKKDGRGLFVFFSGIFLFVIACRLMDVPRLACLGLPLMMYGAARHIFGPMGKCLLIPSLILLLGIPLRQITWLEQNFFETVHHVLLLSGKVGGLWDTGFFLCNDIYYGSVLLDAILGLALLFFFRPMRVRHMFIVSLLVLSVSFVAAVGIYALAVIDAFSFCRSMPVSTLARSAGWVLPLAILVFETFRIRRNKPPEIDPIAEYTDS